MNYVPAGPFHYSQSAGRLVGLQPGQQFVNLCGPHFTQMRQETGRQLGYRYNRRTGKTKAYVKHDDFGGDDYIPE